MKEGRKKARRTTGTGGCISPLASLPMAAELYILLLTPTLLLFEEERIEMI